MLVRVPVIVFRDDRRIDVEVEEHGRFTEQRHGGLPLRSVSTNGHAVATAAIDTFMPGMRTGSFAPCRAGGLTGNHRTHSSFKPAKSSSSRTMTVALTMFSRELPAASRIAWMFMRHW